MTVYMDSTQSWPTHQKQEVQAALLFARQRGWHFAKRTNSFGVVVCKRTEGTDSCQFSIYSTPQTARSHADNFRRKVMSCPHVGEGRDDPAKGQVTGLIQSAGNLLAAAENCMEGEQNLILAQELFELAMVATEEGERHLLLEQSVQTEAQSATVTNIAIIAIRAEGVQVGNSVAIPSVLQEADQRLDQAELISQAPKRAPQGALSDEIDTLRDNIQGLRVRLVGLE